MAFLKEKFSALNSAFPEESNALLVHVFTNSLEQAKIPFLKISDKIESDLRKHQNLFDKWTKGIKTFKFFKS